MVELELLAMQAKETIAALTAALGPTERATLFDAVDKVITIVDREMAGRRYYAIPPSLEELWRVRTEGRSPLVAGLVLAQLIARGATPPQPSALAVAEYAKEFSRILRALSGRSTRGLDLADDGYRKDLALCRLAAVPCRAQIVETCPGIPRRHFIEGGIGQALRLAKLIAGDGGALGPYLETHFHTPMLKFLNPDGWRHSFLVVAELLRARPDHRGLFAAGWFFDPAVKRFSPHLAYLRDIPQEGGAIFLRRTTTREDIENATSMPDARRQAWLDGRYKPSGWFIIWPRARLIAWADRQATPTQPTNKDYALAGS